MEWTRKTPYFEAIIFHTPQKDSSLKITKNAVLRCYTRNTALGNMVGEDGFEPSKSVTTDLQSAPFGRSGTLPYEILELVDGLEPPTC